MPTKTPPTSAAFRRFSTRRWICCCPGVNTGSQRLIGEGGTGEVWLAERGDGQIKRQVELKLPVLRLRRSVLVQRFARERNILAALVHPHIAWLNDAGLAADLATIMLLAMKKAPAERSARLAGAKAIRARHRQPGLQFTAPLRRAPALSGLGRATRTPH